MQLGGQFSVGGNILQTGTEIGICWLNFETRLADLHTGDRKQLRISAQTGAEYFLPEKLRQFELLYPDIALDFVIEARGWVVQKVGAAACEIAVMPQPGSGSEFEHVNIHELQYVVIAAAQHPLALEKRVVQLEELRGERWLLGQHVPWLLGLGADPQASFASYEAAARAVAAGLGVAFVPVELLQVHQDSGGNGQPAIVQLNFKEMPAPQTWSLVWKKGKMLSAAARAFVELFEVGLR